MVFLYAELFALLLVSFLAGSAVAAVAVRLLVRHSADQVASYGSREAVR
jgi:hypothetical protein